MILIYASNITPRLNLIFDFYFIEILNIPYKVTSEITKFETSILPRLNYSEREIEGTIKIKPHSLLFETGINKQEIYVSEWKGSKIFFQNDSVADIPFDLFSAGFYLLTRYEEYLPFKPDQHGRFPAEESLACKNNFLEQPIIDQWAYLLLRIIKKHYPYFKVPGRNFQYTPTIDIDIAYAYKHKGWLRTAGAFTKALVSFNFTDIIKRLKVLLGIQKDPCDTYELLNKLHSKYNLSPIFFFLIGDYAQFDKNQSLKKKAYCNLICETSKKVKVGIHPSYKSNSSFSLLKKEVEDFHFVTKMKTKKSRQHFLKLHMPETYQNLNKLDIKEDYSMGFASLPGFRAGTCTPFSFYDLKKEEQTKLKIHPFQVMDGTLNQYMKLNRQEALSKIEQIVNSIKLVNGTFISLWHNQSLSEQHEWAGWLGIYEEMLEICKVE